MKGYFTTETSDLFWYAKPRGKDKYQISEFYRYGSLKGQAVSLPRVFTIPEEKRQHWIKYRR